MSRCHRERRGDSAGPMHRPGPRHRKRPSRTLKYAQHELAIKHRIGKRHDAGRGPGCELEELHARTRRPPDEAIFQSIVTVPAPAMTVSSCRL